MSIIVPSPAPSTPFFPPDFTPEPEFTAPPEVTTDPIPEASTDAPEPSSSTTGLPQPSASKSNSRYSPNGVDVTDLWNTPSLEECALKSDDEQTDDKCMDQLEDGWKGRIGLGGGAVAGGIVGGAALLTLPVSLPAAAVVGAGVAIGAGAGWLASKFF